MFDIGWQELLVIAAVAIVVVGPKDLPRLLRMAGKYIGKVKRMADDFKEQIDDAVRETELKELKSSVEKEVEGLKNMDLVNDLERTVEDIDRQEAEEKARIEAEKKALELDENLDWDEPDELIEKDAEGKVISQEKKAPQPESMNADDGDLLDEEEYADGTATSGEMIAQARKDLEKRIAEETSLAARSTHDAGEPVKDETARSAQNGQKQQGQRAADVSSKSRKSESADASASEQILP